MQPQSTSKWRKGHNNVTTHNWVKTVACVWEIGIIGPGYKSTSVTVIGHEFRMAYFAEGNETQELDCSDRMSIDGNM
jgi:hypothetical protein